jgi:hypothetical protein
LAPVAGFSAPFFEPPWQHFIALPLLQHFFPHLSLLHILAQSPQVHIPAQSPLQHSSPQVLPEHCRAIGQFGPIGFGAAWAKVKVLKTKINDRNGMTRFMEISLTLRTAITNRASRLRKNLGTASFA